MRHSIVYSSRIREQQDKRFDADYYTHPYRSIMRNMRSTLVFTALKEQINFIGTGHTPYKHDVSRGEVPFVTLECIGDLEFIYGKTKRITKEQSKAEYKNKIIEKGTIVCTIKRRICKAYPFLSEVKEMVPNQDVALIRPKKTLLPGFLAVYLNCSYGQGFADSLKTEQMNPYLSLVNLAKLSVPLLSLTFQRQVNVFVMSSQQLSVESENRYKEAQEVLLEEFGLLDWQPKHTLSYVKNLSDTEVAGRFDAEYFQPKYEEIVAAIKSYSGGWDTLGNLVTVKKCIEVGSDEYLDEGIPFIRVSNLSPHEITEEKYISEKLYEEINVHQPQQGEILFSKDATPGIAYHLCESPKKMIPSGGLLRLKSKTKKIDNDYLTLVLNSVLTKKQVERDVGGSVILHWRPDQVKETVIPILSEAIQTQIRDKVQESFRLRKESKRLLECAKRAVEMAIEESEDVALAWLEKQR